MASPPDIRQDADLPIRFRCTGWILSIDYGSQGWQVQVCKAVSRPPEPPVMHQVKKATGQLRGIIGTRCHVSRIDISPGELLVHMAGGLLVLETVIGARADTLQADWLGWQEDHIVQEGEPGSGAEGLQEPRADHAVVDDRVPAGGQSSAAPAASVTTSFWRSAGGSRAQCSPGR